MKESGELNTEHALANPEREIRRSVPAILTLATATATATGMVPRGDVRMPAVPPHSSEAPETSLKLYLLAGAPMVPDRDTYGEQLPTS
jgi:hypothetical protein